MAQNTTSPKGELRWIFITGKGKKDLNGKDRFTASVYYKNDDPACIAYKAKIDEFWEENKPKGAKCKSLGYRVEEDEEGKPTGLTSFNFWTGITFPDGSNKVVKVYNSGNKAKGLKPTEIFLGAKKIGNGTKGAISGAMDIYDNGVAARGVTLYLNAVQIVNFIEFTGGADFESEDDGGYEGEDTADAGTGFTDDSGSNEPGQGDVADDAPSKPRL